MVRKTMDIWSKEIATWRKGKGFYTPRSISAHAFPVLGTVEVDRPVDHITEADLMLGKLMLVVTEIAEAAEAIRRGDWNNYCEELADVQTRLFDIYGTQHIDIEKHVDAKMEVNAQRPFRHGKRTQL